MATLSPTSISVAAAFTPTTLTLGASDTMTFTANLGALLVLYNVTVGALTPNLDGADGTTVSIPDTGATYSVASGYTFPSIAAGAYAVVRLDSIKAFLQGAVTITGGTGIKAILLTQ